MQKLFGTKVARLAWYASHFPLMPQNKLINIAAHPHRKVLDLNERIVAMIAIEKQGINDPNEVKPIFQLLKDERDYPLFTGSLIERQNNALLRGYAALALAKYGFKRKDFVNYLEDILTRLTTDPVIISFGKSNQYYERFLEALSISYPSKAIKFKKQTL